MPSVPFSHDLPGRDSYDALLELSDFHPEEYPRDRMRVLAERRAEADTEPAAWAAEEVHAFAAAAERGPHTQRDLFYIALYRLDDLKFDLEGGDESEASVLQRVIDEPELRRVIANRLRQSAAGKYTTGSEEELKDKTRTDIRLHHPEVEARIPIELKIADAPHWSAAKLPERLENQLIGQYMDEARYGIFLIVRRGATKDRSRRARQPVPGVPGDPPLLFRAGASHEGRRSRNAGLACDRPHAQSGRQERRNLGPPPSECVGLCSGSDTRSGLWRIGAHLPRSTRISWNGSTDGQKGAKI